LIIKSNNISAHIYFYTYASIKKRNGLIESISRRLRFSFKNKVQKTEQYNKLAEQIIMGDVVEEEPAELGNESSRTEEKGGVTSEAESALN